MKNGRLIMLVSTYVLAFFITANAEEFRPFENKSGKIIEARILEYDADTERVQLEMKNRKKAWIPLADLSEKDQVYLRDMDNTEASPPAKVLSEDDVKDIPNRYVKALKENDVKVIGELFSPHATWSFDQFYKDRNPLKGRGVLQKVKVGKREGLNCYLHLGNLSIDVPDIDEDTLLYTKGWLQLTPDGKIRYCPFLAPNPLDTAAGAIQERARYADALDRNRNHGVERSLAINLRSLKQTGIPVCELEDLRMRNEPSCDDFRNPLNKIAAWIIKEGPKFDVSEPKLYLPEERFEAYETIFYDGDQTDLKKL